MGPYPVLTNKVRVQPRGDYVLWMQRVPIRGGGSFKLYERDASLLVFEPIGSPELTQIVDLKAVLQRGLAPIQKAETQSETFVVTFAGGSVVRMQALRVPAQLATANP